MIFISVITNAQSKSFIENALELAKSNKAMHMGFQQVSNVNAYKLSLFQTNSAGKSYMPIRKRTSKKKHTLSLYIGDEILSPSIDFFNHLSAVFMQIYPKINTFAEAFADNEIRDESTGAVLINIENLNRIIAFTTKSIAHYIRILGDYMELYKLHNQRLLANESK